MLGDPGHCLRRRRFCISEHLKAADGSHLVVSDFHQGVGSQSWHPAENGHQARLHLLDKLLHRAWYEIVLAYHRVHGLPLSASTSSWIALGSVAWKPHIALTFWSFPITKLSHYVRHN